MIREVAAAAGIPNAEELVVHSVRHSSATLAAKHRPLHEVQAFLDHSDPATTAVYTHADNNLSNSVACTIASQLDDAAPIGDERLLLQPPAIVRAGRPQPATTTSGGEAAG